MLAEKIATCIIAFILLWRAKRIDYGYTSRNFILSSGALDVMGVISGVAFSAIMLYVSPDLYTVPKILLFISVCIYIRYKKRRRFCTPLWESLRVTSPIAISFIGADATIEVLRLLEMDGNGKTFLIIAGIMCVVAIGIFIALVNCILRCLPSRRRMLSFYY